MSAAAAGGRARRVPGDDGLFVVGVTGGVASGKTTFVERLAAAGPARVVDADRVGHAILARPPVARALARTFGDDVLDTAGGVDRAVLGARAFASDDALARLNAIAHPPLLAELAAIVGAHAASGFVGLVILDAALLVEWDAGERCDRVVAVLAPPAAQVMRVVAERGLSVERAEAIVARQLPNAARAAYADWTLDNDGTRAAFVAAAEQLAAQVWRAAEAALAGRGRPLRRA